MIRPAAARTLVPSLAFLALTACGGGLPSAAPADTSPPDESTATSAPSAAVATASAGLDTATNAAQSIAADPSFHVDLLAEAAAPKNSTPPTKALRTIAFGLPIPQDAGILVVGGRPALRVAGGAPYQLRVLDLWPNGSAKWVQGHVVGEVGDGVPYEFTVKPGAAYSKHDWIASDWGDHFVLDTGPLRVEVDKLDFDVFRRVFVDGLQIVKTHESKGIVGTTEGGEPLTLGPGADVYLEDNGPARAVVRADGTLVDPAGSPIVDVTCRMIAGAGQRHVEVQLTVRNANIQRPGHVLLGSLGVEVAAATGIDRVAHVNTPVGPISGAVGAQQSVSAYQSYSKALAFDVTGNGPNYKPPIPKLSATEFEQEGWYLKFDEAPVYTGDAKQYPENGFANLAGVNGGVTAAIKHMPHFWPASFELTGLGSVTADVWSRNNPYGFAFVWRQHESRSMAFAFHTGTPGPQELVQVSRRLDNPVLARALDYGHYDRADAFPYPLVTIDEQDAAYAAMGIDHVVDVENEDRQIYRFLPAGSGGGHNNHSIIERWLVDEFLRHGHGGQLQRALDLALYKAEWQIERSDNFHHDDDPGPLLNAGAEVTENVQGDNEHRYREGMIYTYYMTGDTRILEALADEMEILPGLYVSEQERGMYQSIRALVHLADFVDVVPGAADELVAALRTRIHHQCLPTLDVATGQDGYGWETAPGLGARGYFVNSNQAKSEKPSGENYITRGFITANLGATAMHLAADYLGLDDPDGLVCAGRLEDIATYTRQELFPYHPVPAERKLVYSYGVQTTQHLVWTQYDFHTILLGMADAWRLTGDAAYLQRGVEFVEAFEARDHLHHTDTKLDNMAFFAAIRDYVEANGALP